MKNHQTLVNLQKFLANSYALLLKTQNYHWNIVGQNFKPLHDLFQVQYEDLFLAIDEIAERIRSLGAKVDGSFENFLQLINFKKANCNANAKEMLLDLISDNETIIKQLHQFIKIAQEEQDESTADIFIQRAKVHEKALWMLVSSQ